MATATTYETMHIDVALEDISAMDTIKTVLKHLKGVRSVKVSTEPKVKTSEKEFYAKIDHSIATSSPATNISMKPDETGEEFVKRILAAQ